MSSQRLLCWLATERASRPRNRLRARSIRPSWNTFATVCEVCGGTQILKKDSIEFATCKVKTSSIGKRKGPPLGNFKAGVWSLTFLCKWFSRNLTKHLSSFPPSLLSLPSILWSYLTLTTSFCVIQSEEVMKTFQFNSMCSWKSLTEDLEFTGCTKMAIRSAYITNKPTKAYCYQIKTPRTESENSDYRFTLQRPNKKISIDYL